MFKYSFFINAAEKVLDGVPLDIVKKSDGLYYMHTMSSLFPRLTYAGAKRCCAAFTGFQLAVIKTEQQFTAAKEMQTSSI